MTKVFVVICVFCTCTLPTLVAQSLSLDSCYAMAVRNFPLIRQYDLIDQSREFTLNNAGKAYLPQVSLTAIEGYVFGGLPGSDGGKLQFIGLAQVNQTIWDGGATKTQKQIIEAGSAVEKASVEVSLHELRARVNQLYFGILMIDEQLKQLAVQSNVLLNNLNKAKLLSETGVAYKTDVDEVKVEQLKIAQKKTDFNYTRSGYLGMLSYIIGAPISANSMLEKPVTNVALTETHIVRPELALYEHQRKLASAQAEMQKVNTMPKIGLMGAGIVLAPGASLGPEKFSSIGVAGLSASWNISGLYKKSNEKQLSKLQVDKINVQQETFLFNTTYQMKQYSATMEKQKAILADDREIVKLLQTVREGYQLKYASGVGTMIDLLNATEREADANAQKALHEMQLLMTMYDFKTVSGN